MITANRLAAEATRDNETQTQTTDSPNAKVCHSDKRDDWTETRVRQADEVDDELLREQRPVVNHPWLEHLHPLRVYLGRREVLELQPRDNHRPDARELAGEGTQRLENH